MTGGLRKGNIIPKTMAKRIVKLCETLGTEIWEGRKDLQVFGGPVNKRFLALDEGKKQRMRPVKPGEYFGPPDANNANISEWQQRWFKVHIPAAASAEKGRRALFWDCRGEATVYINNIHWAGLDICHGYCVLPDYECDVWIDNGLYQTAIWSPGKTPDTNGLRFDGAWIACRNNKLWETYWDMVVLVETLRRLFKEEHMEFGAGATFIPEMQEMNGAARKMLRRLHDACEAYDSDGINSLARELKSIYSEFPAETWQIDLNCCGHGHLDLVWYWPEQVGERKAAHTAATMLRLMERYPEFMPMMTQPAMYEALREKEPALYRRIAKRIKERKWEATGGFWVEADTILPCGEALARSLVLGQKNFAKLRDGEISSNVWLPDVFGYSACMPQLMRLAGIHSFLTTKLKWSEITVFPYDSLVWRGQDGSEVLAHMSRFLTMYGNPDLCRQTAREFRQADIHNEMLCPLGVGDGGGGPNEDDCERVRRMQNLAQLPRVKWGKVEDFFKRMEKIREKLPIFQGEFYLELHRGTFTTQSQFKYWHRRAETSLRAHEATQAALGKGPVPARPWERVCFAHFHDAIPGSSINNVYAEMTPELRQLGEEAMEAARKNLTGSGTGYAFFNTLPFKRKAIVELPEKVLSNEQKQVLQKTGKGKSAAYLGLVELDAIASASTDSVKASVFPEVSPRVLDNGCVKAGFDVNGRLRRLIVNGKQLALSGAAEFMLHIDNPAHNDGWEIDQHTLVSGKSIAGLNLEVVEQGPVRAKLRGKADIGEKSKITVEYILEAETPWLIINVNVDWQESHKLLRYQVPTDYHGRDARFGGPFGSVLRQQTPGIMDVESKWEVPASRWAAVTEESGGEGLAVISEAKYGYSCRDGLIGLSLLRAPKHPDQQTDMGRHTIRFAVGKHEILTGNGVLNTACAAEALFEPIVSVNKGKTVKPRFTVEQFGSLAPYWTLPSETGKGFVLRLHETMGLSGNAVLRLTKPAEDVQLVDILERPIGKPRKLANRAYRIDYRPYQITSVLVR